MVVARETREGWLLLTDETEANGDLESSMKGALPWLVRWACRAGTRDFCLALGALVGPEQKYFFPSPHNIAIHLSLSIAQQARQAVVLGRLSLNICLWYQHHARTPGPPIWVS